MSIPSCPKCTQRAVIKVTQSKGNANPDKPVRERRGAIVAIITAPFRAIAWLFRYGFRSQKETYFKETAWRCNSCGNMWQDEPVKEEVKDDKQTV